MKVFISWSGEPSRSIANALDGWIESVVQRVDAWMSDEEIGSGARWSDAIAKSLDETNFGIVCVTRENQHSPWLIFEAGALAKSVQSALVVPLCVDLAPSDVTGPLAAFQGRSLDEDGVRRLVHDLNAATEKPMPKEQLDKLFDAMWPELQASVTAAIDNAPASQEPHRRSEDMLGELVDRIRRIERNLLRPRRRFAPGDTVTLDNGVSYRVPNDPEEVRKLEDLFSFLFDDLYSHTATTVVARANIPTPTVVTKDNENPSQQQTPETGKGETPAESSEEPDEV